MAQGVAQVDLVQAFEARLALYGLDDESRRVLAECWPLIGPQLEKAIDEIIVAVRVLPRRESATAR